MAFTGFVGAKLSLAGNVVPAFGAVSQTALAGVPMASVGTQYDVAIGWDNGLGTVNMVGYVLQEHQNFTETTDIQDNDRLIQIASPNSTDRFTFYPKVSQSDWAGGERQVIFVDPNRYYASQKLETSLPGHLFIYGSYYDLGALPASTGAVSPSVHNASWNTQAGPGTDVYAAHIAAQKGSTNNSIRVNTANNPPTLSGEIIGPGGGNLNNVQELYHSVDYVYAALSGGGTQGIYRYNGTSWDNPGSDRVQPTGQILNAAIGPQMAYFENALYYVLYNSAPNKINKIVNPNATPQAGTTVLTSYDAEAIINALGTTATGLSFSTNGMLWNGAFQPAGFYTWDGAATTGTLLGRLPVVVIDIAEVVGVTFMLCVAGFATEQPFIMALSSGSLSVFDDYRLLPADFQTKSAHNIGNLSDDGTFLYMSYPGLNTKRYDLRTYPSVVVSDIGKPESSADAVGHTAVASGGRLLDITTAPIFSYVAPSGPGGTIVAGDSGYLITSYFDLGAPTITKVFRSLEIELNAALGGAASVAVYYQLDNQTGFPNTLSVTSLSNNNLIGYFPVNTKASKIQFKLILTASSQGQSPDIRSYSLNARLGRTQKWPLQIRRKLTLHNGALDQQGGSAKDKLANLLNAYRVAAGNIVMFVPDPTAANGVSQINAVLEDYEYATPKPGPDSSEQGGLDMECDINLTTVERL